MLVSSTTQSPYVPTNHPVYLPTSLCTYQSPCVPTTSLCTYQSPYVPSYHSHSQYYLPTSLCTYQSPYVPTNHPMYLPITLCTYQSPYVPTSHPAYLHTYLLQYLNQCLRTLTSLVLVQIPSGVQFLLTLLRPLLTHGLLSIPVSRSGSETSGNEVLSDREGATRRPGGLAGTGSDSDVSDSEYSLSVDLKSR